MSIESRIEREVIGLHEFFARWYRAELPDSDESFARFAAAVSPDFHIITPCSSVVQREAILKSLRGAYGCYRDAEGGFSIDMRNVRPRVVND